MSVVMDVSSSAAHVRSLLRDAGYVEYEPGRRGFAVEGDPEGGWVSVSCQRGLPWARTRQNRDLQDYSRILSAAGYLVKDSPWLRGALRLTLPSEAAEPDTSARADSRLASSWEGQASNGKPGNLTVLVGLGVLVPVVATWVWLLNTLPNLGDQCAKDPQLFASCHSHDVLLNVLMRVGVTVALLVVGAVVTMAIVRSVEKSRKRA
jgi:hypothetical protein